MSSITENQYYLVKAETKARIFEILRTCDNMTSYITAEEDELAYDAAASIEHNAEMVLFAYEQAEKAIDDEMRKMFVELNHERV